MLITQDNLFHATIGYILSRKENYASLLKPQLEKIAKKKEHKIVLNTILEQQAELAQNYKSLIFSTIKNNLSEKDIKQINSFIKEKDIPFLYIKNEIVSAIRASLIKEIQENKDDTLELKTEIDKLLTELHKDFNEEANKKYDTNEAIDSYLSYLKESKALNELNDGVVGVDTGFSELNDFTRGFKKAEYILIGARPSMGKTSFALDNFLVSIRNQSEGEVSVMFSLEMPRDQIMGRLISKVTGLSLRKTLYGDIEAEDEAKIIEALNFLRHKEFYIYDFQEDGIKATPAILENKLELLVNNDKKIKLVLIDYIQLLSIISNRYIPATEVTTELSKNLKRMAKRFNAPFLILSQLNRELEKRVDKRPQMSDLRESGALEQDADLILFLYREIVYAEKELKEKATKGDASAATALENLKRQPITNAEVIVAKNRNGPTGIINMLFEKETASYLDPMSGYNEEELLAEIAEGEDAMFYEREQPPN